MRRPKLSTAFIAGTVNATDEGFAQRFLLREKGEDANNA